MRFGFTKYKKKSLAILVLTIFTSLKMDKKYLNRKINVLEDHRQVKNKNCQKIRECFCELFSKKGGPDSVSA